MINPTLSTPHNHRLTHTWLSLYLHCNILSACYSQIHLLAEMDAKESVGGVNTKESMSYELLGKLENEEYKLERFRALDYRMVENSE